MKNITDKELINEISRRIEEYNHALYDLKAMTQKLEFVNRRLQESEATKSNFLSNIRNEINNPLASIMGLSKQLSTADMRPSKVREVAEAVFSEAFDLDYQLNNIFLAAELEAGESELGIAEVELDKFIARIIASFEHKIDAKNLNVKLECLKPGENASFMTDPLKLKSILTNLIANAIEFSFEGKTVTVTVSRQDGGIAIAVSDLGPGIATEERDRIYDRFRQLDSGVSKTHRGHGLGLSIVKSLLNQLGGTVEFTSVAGEGCRFTITLPEAQGAPDVFAEEGNEFIFGGQEEF
jgi:signal transduction histidine kinase